MRRIDWLVVMMCVSLSIVTSIWAYCHGERIGREESERHIARQIRALNMPLDHDVIKADLAGGRNARP